MSTRKLAAFEAFAEAFRAYLETLPTRYLPLINAQHGMMGYIAPDAIYYICFNPTWAPKKCTDITITGRLLGYKCDGSWNYLLLRPVDFVKENIITCAYANEYYPHHMGDSHRGFILNDTIQFTSSDRELLIGYKPQRISVGSTLFSHCKYYYDINFNQVKPIKTKYKCLDFAKIYDVEPHTEQELFCRLEGTYYFTGQPWWQVQKAGGGRYLYIQLASSKWALYDGIEAPILL